MTPITAELIRQHPALSAFNDYIQQNLGHAPDPADIVVSNNAPNDGIIQISYVDPQSHETFAAQLSASRSTGALEVNHGPIRNVPVVRHGHRVVEQRVEYVNAHATPINVTGACETVHALGGEEESSFTCPAATNPNSSNLAASAFSTNLPWMARWGTANWIGAELIGLLWKRRSLTLGTLRSIPGWMRPTGTNELGLMERASLRTPMIAGGLLAVASSEYGAGNILGLHSNYHTHERFAMDAYAAWGGMLGASYLINRLRGTRLQPVDLGAGLLTSAIVDATLGQMYAEGSAERRALRVGGFFLPELYRVAIGNRSLAIAETRVGSGFARWGGRVMRAGFYADAAYMLYNSLSSSTVESGRTNLIYRRANELQASHLNPVVWALHGVAGMVAPSLTERYLVSGNYVDQASREIHAQASADIDSARSFLRYSLLMGPIGPSTDANFYRSLDLSWLRGENTLRNIRRPDGRELPVADVADQFSDPAIYERVIVNGTPEQQITYIQQQFRGFSLSREDVQEILARITLHHVRSQLQDLQYTAGDDLRGFAACFDNAGSLRAGQEQNLISQVFPDQSINGEQVLALRRVALARRILELRNSDPSGTELASYTQVAREIGLVDANGQLSDSEETRLAQSSLDSHPTQPDPTVPTRPTQLQILQGIAAYSAHG